MRKMKLAFIWIGYKKGLRAAINTCLLGAVLLGAAHYFFEKDLAGGPAGAAVLSLAYFVGAVTAIKRGRHPLAGMLVVSTVLAVGLYLSSFTDSGRLSIVAALLPAAAAYMLAVAALYLRGWKKFAVVPLSRFLDQ